MTLLSCYLAYTINHLKLFQSISIQNCACHIIDANRYRFCLPPRRLSAVLNNVWIRCYDVNASKTRRPFENNLKETQEISL